MQLNRQAPHQRDIDRFTAAVEKLNRDLPVDASIDVQTNRASTGTVYATVNLIDETGDEIVDETRVYRFGSHAECYASHDYSVRSGGGAKASDPLPPGYDGYTTQAIADLHGWVDRVRDGE